MAHSRSAVARTQRVIENIDPEAMRTAFADVLSRYGWSDPLPPFAICTVEDLAIRDSRTGKLRSGAAGEEGCVLFPPGLRARMRQEHNFRLLALHVFIHEQMHVLSGERLLRKGILKGNGLKISFEQRVIGLGLCTSSRGREILAVQTGLGYFYLNEAVTEMLARSVTQRYLELRPMRLWKRVGPKVQEHLVRRQLASVYYVEALNFYRKLVDHLAKVTGRTPNSIWVWLVHAYMCGTDLTASEGWLSLLKSAGLSNLAQDLFDADIMDLSLMENRTFSFPPPAEVSFSLILRQVK